MSRVIIVIFWLLIAVLVYNDAKKRNMSPVLWAILVFFFPLIALIIYFILRKPKTM